jgi:nucleoid-associated protein YgaU
VSAPASQSAPTAGSGAAPSPTISYTVQSGDTLSAIAKKFLGNPDDYMDIFNANRDRLRDPNTVESGQVLRIPQHTKA